MPMPWSYRHSEKEFKSFLKDAKGRMGHIMESDNMTYTAVDGVLQCFRRRLTPPQVIAFGDVLPSTLRAMLVYNWRVDAVPLPFGTRSELIREAQSLRKDHNITPLNVIDATAYALWRHCNHRDLKRVLDAIGPEAVAFWAVRGIPETKLEQQII
ncbi:DUF2267 domain-containing protein [Celeribacter sp. HF31]|uniref:DUF2267 domain-containing protein n=1 Tax=Celeribacter sp. HF31 TaxID=2721558 RepID=UPI0014310E63|nr:DUF2267 domain-containing protein [Celeribacter sp. HF31]NIY80528.1 DUF2267 domain-containing protein [Celeribacter sp. HF31]